MKENSIDYLFQQLWDRPKDKLTWYAILKEAKEKHEQEIIDARQSGIDATINGKSISNIDYYNETFKQK